MFCLTLERVAQLVKALQSSKNVPSLAAHRVLDQTHSHNLIKKLKVALPLNFLTLEMSPYQWSQVCRGTIKWSDKAMLS